MQGLKNRRVGKGALRAVPTTFTPVLVEMFGGHVIDRAFARSTTLPTLRIHTTDWCRSMQVRSTSSIGLLHQSLEKISISE